MSTFIFLDFEFTMFDKREVPKGFFHEVIEIGTIVVKDNEIVDEFASFVKPERFPLLSDKIMELTSISQEQVNTGIDFRQMIDRLEEQYVPQETTIVTWGEMDISALRRNCKERKTKFPLPVMLEDWLDLSSAYQHYYGLPQKPGLWKALAASGVVEEKQSHRALDDSLATLYVFNKMKQDGWDYIHPREVPQLTSSIEDLLGQGLFQKLKKYIPAPHAS